MAADPCVPGYAVGSYILEERIGEGATAVVWRARCEDGEKRALKVLHPTLLTHDAIRSRFVAEGRLLAAIVHPHVLRVHEVVETPSLVWYSMDWMAAGTLQRRLDERGACEPREALSIVFQALQALEAIHRAGIVHRDVKPHNLLVHEDTRIILADFGSARQGAGGPLTRTGDVLGTLGYMAPEQRSDARKAAPPTDIYAVGATFFGLVTGRPPLGLFEGQLDQEELARLPNPIRELIRNATRYRPEWRFPTARHMAVEVARVYDILLDLAGSDSASVSWIRRFDDTLAACTLPEPVEKFVPPSELLPVGARRVAPVELGTGRNNPRYNPAERTLPRAQATPAPMTLWQRFRRWLTLFLSRFQEPTPIDPRALFGVWEGRLGGTVPIRLEIEAIEGGRVGGWALTTALQGEVATRVEGSVDGAWLLLDEITERQDRGRYRACLRGPSLTGKFEPGGNATRPINFSLIRAAGLPTGGT